MKSLLKSILRETNNPILHNKFILYAVFFIALVYLFGLSIQRSWFHIAIFILIGYVSTFFSKNMMVILLISTIFTFVLKNGTNISHEGFEEKLYKENMSQNQEQPQEQSQEQPQEEEEEEEEEEQEYDE